MKKFKYSKKALESTGSGASQHQEKWKWKTRYTVGIFIIFVMVFSVVGFLNTEQPNTYNKITFVQVQKGWIAKTDFGRLLFSTHPSNVEQISVPAGVVQTLHESKVMMLTHDPGDPNKELLAMLGYNFLRLVEMENKENEKTKQVFFGVTQDLSSTPSRQTTQINQTASANQTNFTQPKQPANQKTIDCNDASPYIPVVKYETVNRSVMNATTNITFTNNCIILRGASESALVEVGDRLLYGYLGIIEDQQS